MIRNVAIIITIISISTAALASDCGCEGLLAQGVFARRDNVRVDLLATAEHELFCEASASTARQIANQYFSLGISLPETGDINLGGEFSDESYEDWKKSSCRQSDASMSSQRLVSAFSSIADPDLINGFNECVATCQSGRGGLFCKIQDIDDTTSAVFVAWRPRTNSELQLPTVTSVRVGGGELVNADAISRGVQIPIGGILATVARRSPSSVLAVEINTEAEPCSVRSEPPITEYTVRATLRASGVIPVFEERTFQGDHHTNGDCGMNENRRDTFCLPNGATVTDASQASIRTQNCGTRVVAVSKDGSCVNVDVNLKGCGNPCQVSNPFGGCIVRECKGNGWIGYDLSVKGERYQPGETAPREEVKTAQIAVGETGSVVFAYPPAAIGSARELQWRYTVEIQRRRGGRYLPTLSFSEGGKPPDSDIEASVSPSGVLTITLHNREKRL